MTKDLKELAKGAVRRLHGKFDPDDATNAPVKGRLLEWQGMMLGRGDAPPGQDPRNGLFPIDHQVNSPGERARAFNKLAARTQMRRNPETGEREFLLHRGAGADEVKAAVKNGVVNHSDASSWTPNWHIANGFKNAYDKAGKESHVLSAWMPESKIAGSVHQFKPDPNMHHEHEIIVNPNHATPLVDYKPKAPSPMMAKLAARKTPAPDSLNPKAVQKSLADTVLNRYSQTKLAKSFSPKDLNTAKDQSFPPGQLDASAHSVQRWANHAPEVFHGMSPDTVPAAPQMPGVTSHAQFIGGSDKRPRAIVKPPMDWKELNLDPSQDDGPATSYMMDPNFRTSHREAAYHLMADKVFGMGDFVPKTTVFRHPRTGEHWSAQEFVPGAEHLTHPASQLHHYTNSDTLHKLAIMDTIMGHNDRHAGNVLIDPNMRIHLIDNAGAFEYAHRFQKPIPKYAAHLQHQAVPASAHAWISKLSPEKMANALNAAGAPADVAHTALKRLAEAKRWSRVVGANPDASKELGGALQAIRTHQFGDDQGHKIMDDARRMLYDRIKRGEHVSRDEAEAPDQTVVEKV